MYCGGNSWNVHTTPIVPPVATCNSGCLVVQVVCKIEVTKNGMSPTLNVGKGQDEVGQSGWVERCDFFTFWVGWTWPNIWFGLHAWHRSGHVFPAHLWNLWFAYVTWPLPSAPHWNTSVHAMFQSVYCLRIAVRGRYKYLKPPEAKNVNVGVYTWRDNEEKWWFIVPSNKLSWHSPEYTIS